MKIKALINTLTSCFLIISVFIAAGCGGGGSSANVYGSVSSPISGSEPDTISGSEPDIISENKPDTISGSEPDQISGGEPDTISGSEPDPAYIGAITLAWDPPTENDDGTTLTDLAGYKIYYGTSSGDYTESIDLGNVTTATLDNLSPGIWCFTGTAYNSSGNESNYSTEFCEYI